MNDGSLRYISEPPQVPLLDVARRRIFSLRNVAIAIACLIPLISLYYVTCSAPGEFPVDTVLSIPQGQTLTGIVNELTTQGAIRSSFVFKSFTVLFGGRQGLKAGDYYLETKQSALVLAWRLTHSDYSLKNIKITIPEGWSSTEIAHFIAKDKRFSKFSAKEFIKISEKYEGYLFPDTYFLPKNSSALAILEKLENNFLKKTNSLKIEAEAKGLDWEEVIVLASIIEEEASGKGDREMISGILQKRISKGIRLQADATVFYGMKVAGIEGDFDSDFDSEYNTYLHSGLPPKPITNPGILSIEAAINPKYSDYLYYLHDKEGNVYYAKTYDEHRSNINKYLK